MIYLISAIFVWAKNPKVAGYGQNKLKMAFLIGSVDGLSYFFNNFQIFYFLTGIICKSHKAVNLKSISMEWLNNQMVSEVSILLSKPTKNNYIGRYLWIIFL
jgi:hypothetical protein